MRWTKYGNRKTVIDGQTFDSAKEARRWQELRLLEKAGEISELRRQVSFEIIPTQKDEAGETLERKATYIADFVYRDAQGKLIVEDSKGARTQEYILKRKLMLERYGIRILET